MLHLYFEPLSKLIKRPEFIRYPSDYFDGVWELDWISDSFGRSVIESIDQVELGDDVVFSLLKAGLRVEDLCTGTKNLLLCKHLNKLNRITMMGENCFPFLMDIAESKEVYMGCSNTVFFKDYDLKGRKVHFVNIDAYADNAIAFLERILEVEEGGVVFD